MTRTGSKRRTKPAADAATSSPMADERVGGSPAPDPSIPGATPRFSAAELEQFRKWAQQFVGPMDREEYERYRDAMSPASGVNKIPLIIRPTDIQLLDDADDTITFPKPAPVEDTRPVVYCEDCAHFSYPVGFLCNAIKDRVDFVSRDSVTRRLCREVNIDGHCELYEAKPLLPPAADSPEMIREADPLPRRDILDQILFWWRGSL